MDEQYLCRGKRIGSGEWVCGYLMKRPSPIQIGDSSPWCIQVPPADPDDSGGIYWVDPFTVGRCTGIRDINDALIFAGHIVELIDGYAGKIDWDEYTARFVVLYDGNIQSDFDALHGCDMEIIGNIHDNPELLRRGRVDDWISVKDSLPQDDSLYLVCYVFGDSQQQYLSTLNYYSGDERPHFQHEGIDGLTVTHWMPLPHPPERRPEHEI